MAWTLPEFSSQTCKELGVTDAVSRGQKCGPVILPLISSRGLVNERILP